jgi:hypothetical protein
VGNTGDHEYTEGEAKDSLQQAYKRRPRGHTPEQVEKDLKLFEYAAWYGRVGLKEGANHWALQTVMGVSAIARRAGRTQGISLALRDFNEFGVKKDMARRHLQYMVADGLLTRSKKSDYARATMYDINLDLVRQATPSGDDGQPFKVEQSPAYHHLQGMPHFRQGARIDARLWVGEPPSETLGPTVQRIIATLQTFSVSHGGCHRETYNSSGTTALHVCLITTPPLTMASLFRLSDVNPITGRRKLRLLVVLGICAWEYGEGDSKLYSLTDNWYERLIEIAPALTTHGHDVLLAYEYDKQRIANHQQLQQRSKGDKLQLHQQAAGNASSRLQQHEADIATLNARRQAWAASQGITGDIPHISLHGPAKPKRIQQPVAAQGRKVIPMGRTHVGKNRRTVQDIVAAYTRQQAERRYERLVKTPAPNEYEKSEASALAARLNRTLEWQRVELTLL